MKFSTWLLFGCWVCCSVDAHADRSDAPEGVGLYLHVLDFDVEANFVPADGGPIVVRVEGHRPLRLLDVFEALQLSAELQADDSIVVRLPSAPTFAAGQPERYLAPSWLVDTDHSAFTNFREAHFPDEADSWGGREIAEFAARYMRVGAQVSDFHVASRVVTDRTGDCSEYAVLSAAFARLLKVPSRIVLGVLILLDEEQRGAYGHAWNEVMDDGQWVIADATRVAAKPTRAVYYLPLLYLSNEGPGYGINLLALMDLLPTSLKVMGQSGELRGERG